MNRPEVLACPFNRMKPCVKAKCSLWRVDACVFMNIDKELYIAVDLMVHSMGNREEAGHVDSK